MLNWIYKRKKLFFEILSVFIIVITLVFFAIFMLLSQETNELLEAQKIADSILLADNVSKNIDMYQKKVTGAFINILSTSETTNITQEELGYFFRNYIGYNFEIVEAIYFLKSREDIISSDNVLQHLNQDTIKELYDNAYNKYGYAFWSKPYLSSATRGRTIAIVKPVMDNNGNEKGVLIAEINLETLATELASLIDSKYQSVAIFYNGSLVIKDNKSTLLPEDESNNNFDDLTGLKIGVNEINFDENEVIAIRTNANILEWDVVLLTDKDIYYEKITKMRESIITYTLIGFVILLVSIFFVSRMISNPIRKMASHMDKFDEEDLMKNLISIKRNDEIGTLAESYNNLIKKIDYLIKSQKEIEQKKKIIEQKMLLSQIKPHLLYNTLICIIGLAEKNQQQKIEETIRSLLMLLSFSIDKKDEFITLYEEIEVLKSYIYIKKSGMEKILISR